MSYRREDIPELIRAFQAAKSALSNHVPYLCIVLNRGASPAKDTAIGIVEGALGGSYTLESWANGGVVSRPIWGVREARRMRARWCDKIVRDLREYAKAGAKP